MATATLPPPVAAPAETLDHRVGRLEGAYEHLATKADLSQLEARLYRSFWLMTGVMMASIITAIGVATWVILSALPNA